MYEKKNRVIMHKNFTMVLNYVNGQSYIRFNFRKDFYQHR